MEAEARRSLVKARFIRGSIDDLIKLAEAEKFDMLAYILEMARLESDSLEAKFKAVEP